MCYSFQCAGISPPYNIYLSSHLSPQNVYYKGHVVILSFYFWNISNTLNDLWAQTWKAVLKSNSLRQ
jgi:hypothetical protein